MHRDGRPTQLAFSFFGFAREDMSTIGFGPFQSSFFGHLEPFGDPSFGFHFRHVYFPFGATIM